MLGAGLLTRMWTSRRPTPLSTIDAYARWAPVYPPRAHNAVMQAEEGVVRTLLRGVAPVRALDVGTGTGRNLALLREASAATVVGVDLSAPMLLQGREGFVRVRGNALALPFRTGAFDLVTSSLMCGDVADLGPWLREAARVLARGGHLIYSDFHPGWFRAGWRRTFVDADGRTCEVPLHHHEIEEHLKLMAAAGLHVRAIREPRAAQRPTPVVVVFHAVRDPAEFG